MKTTFLFITLLTLSSSIFAQENRDTSTINAFPFPDVEAEFPGGAVALMKYISQNITYPENYRGTTGKIYVSFIVNTDGYVSDVKVERGLNEEFDSMAKNLILNMPQWKPAELNGMGVKTRVKLPIIIP
ncbi:MAG: protein TonB [Crocinitomicaceae bacterium]|jgi:protein TonB